MSQLEIKELALPDISRWNAYVLAHPKATFFHRAEWKQAIEDVYGHECRYLYAEEDGRIVGVLPLVRIKSLLFGHSLTSVAFCVYGGPVFDDDQVRRALNQRAIALADELGVGHIEYRSMERTAPDWACKEDAHATFIKPIEADPEANLLAIPRKQRAVVRKSLRPGSRAPWTVTSVLFSASMPQASGIWGRRYSPRNGSRLSRTSSPRTAIFSRSARRATRQLGNELLLSRYSLALLRRRHTCCKASRQQ